MNCSWRAARAGGAHTSAAHAAAGDSWTRGEPWNGFACPLFAEPTARAVICDLNASGNGRAELDEWTGVISVLDDDHPGEPERFGPEVVQMEGRPVRFWAVGAMAWAWLQSHHGVPVIP